MNEELIYLYDPLCGWCYGFGPSLLKLAENEAQNIPFRVMAGGMITGERVGPIGQIAPYVKTAYKRVEELSGVRFGKAFLDMLFATGETIFDSEPPSRAAIILKEAKPEWALKQAHEIQKIIYEQGLDPNLAASYHTLASENGLDAATFDSKFNDYRYKLAVKDEFDYVAQFGVSGYPSLVYKQNEQYYLLSNGFMPYENLAASLLSLKDKIQQGSI
jgi:putative protein-disulfide isomerase